MKRGSQELAGIVNITKAGPKNGSVTIGFNSHQRTAGIVDVVERRTIGADGDFTSTPAKHVALRQITLIDVGSSWGDPGGTWRFKIGDTIDQNDVIGEV